MKKLIFSIFCILFFFCSQSVNADSWDDFANVDRMWDGQKSITNQDFEQVIDKLEEKGKQQEEKIRKKKRKKKFGKGTTLHEELNPDIKIQELEPLTTPTDLIINIPVRLMIENSTLEKGYYKVVPFEDKDAGKKFIQLYQSHFLKGQIEMNVTENDFQEAELNFVKLIPYNESFVRIIYGSLEYNGYAFVPFIE